MTNLSTRSTSRVGNSGVGIWQLSVIGLLIVSMTVGALILFVLRSEYNATQVQNIISQEQIQSNLLEQRQLAYSDIKQQTVDALGTTNVANSRIDNSQFDQAFFDEYYQLFDNDAQPNEIIDFLFGQFGEDDFELMQEILLAIGDQVDEVGQTVRGSFKLYVTWTVSAAMYAGWVAGAIWRLSAAITALGATVAPPFGVLIGAAVGVAITYAITKTLEFFFQGTGWESRAEYFRQEFASVWWLWNASLDINCAAILARVLIG